jgi:tRNA pseudouridine13 synthase
MDGNIAYLNCMEPVIVGTHIETNDGHLRTDALASIDQSIAIVSKGTDRSVSEPRSSAAAAMDSVSVDTTDQNAYHNKRKLDEFIPPPLSQPVWSTLETELSNLIQNEDVAKEAILFLQSLPPDTSLPIDVTNGSQQPKQHQQQQQQYIVLPALMQKEQRRAVHEWIKQRLLHIAAADTVEGGTIRIWRAEFRSNMPNKLDHADSRHQSRRNKSSTTLAVAPPRDRPYLQFVLYKENMDTGLATQMLAKRANSFGSSSSSRCGSKGNNNRRIRLGYAGNKDKRGITCQYITIPARDTSIKHLCNVFNKQQQQHGSSHDDRGAHGSGHTQTAGVGMIRVGNFSYTQHELRLGRLRGNRFDIALRNIITHRPSETETCHKTLLKNAVCHLRQSGFINYFGTQRFGKYHNTHITGLAIVQGDYRTAVDTILCPPILDDQNGENGVCTAQQGNNALIRAAQIQWRDRFRAVQDDVSIEARSEIERDAARQMLNVMNHYMQSEIAILQSLCRFPLDYEKAFACITKTMRMMFIHAVQSLFWNKCASYRIDTLGQDIAVGDLVLARSTTVADDGKHELYSGENGEGCPEVVVVTEMDVMNGRYGLDDVVLPLVGVKTRNPDNTSGLYLDSLLAEYKISREMINTLQHRDFHCSGDYRKLICRPNNVEYEIIRYEDELQPLLQTDLMKLSGIDVPHRINNQSHADENSIDVASTSQLTNTASLLGMVIGFTLPSSSYATICLRELMKRPTSSEYQRQLNFGCVSDGTVNEKTAVEMN